MTKTKLQNTTDSTLILNESQAGVLRKLCEVEPKGSYEMRSRREQTYKEYLCVSENSNQFTLSSDDLCEWKEILIKLNASVGADQKLVWEGNIGRVDKAASDHGNKSGGATPPPANISVMSKLRNRVVGLFH